MYPIINDNGSLVGDDTGEPSRLEQSGNLPRHAQTLLYFRHPSATDNRLKTTSLHRFVRKKRRAPRPPHKAAVVIGKEVGLRSTDEPQACSPMMACRGFAIPANTTPKTPIPRRREAAVIGGHRAKLAARMRGVLLAEIYAISTRSPFGPAT